MRSALALLTLLAVTVPAPAVAADDGLLLHYKLDETAGATATDSSGHGRHGTVHGTPGWSGGLVFNGSDTHITAPGDLLDGLDAITVAFDVRIDPAQATPYFLYGFGSTDPATGHGDGYLFATGNGLRTSISLSNWTGEQTTRPADGHNLARGVWKHVTYTQSGTTGTLYEDGVAVATNTAISIEPGAVAGGVNYFGRSLYTGDRYFHGRMRDVRVYDRALSADEAATLAAPSNAEAVAADEQALDLGDTDRLTADLTLPRTAPNGSAITWATSDAGVITETGKITRPAQDEPDATATLTATLRRGAATGSKTFPVTVRAALSDADNAAAAARALVVHNLDDVRGNLALAPTASWVSSDPGVISPTGVVKRPAAGTGSVRVTLTATVTYGTANASREFEATVPPLPRRDPYQGYLFSYFTGEGYRDGEQVYNALSDGNDPLRWREVNGGRPVLTSTLGENGLRDPFIIRSPEGDKFYQIATDLKIHGNGDWDAAQRSGSKSIMVWESTDLVNWTDQRLVRVSPDTAGNTWAPEAFYSSSLGSYVVFWASKLYAVDDPGHAGSSYNRMMYATTRDFHTFSEPRVWKDPGYSVIDSTVVEHDGVYHRITKDERNNSSSSPCSKFLIQEKATDLLDPEWDFVAECIGSGALSRGEGPLVFKSNTEEKWYLFIDEYGGRGYVPFSTTDLGSGVWTPEPAYTMPSRPRHGTVLPVTQAEYDRIAARYEDPAPAAGLRVHYRFDDTGGTVAADSSGNGFDGVYSATPAWGTGVDGRSFAMTGSSYVTVPNGVLRQAESATVAVWAKWGAATTINQWIYGLGPDSTKYLFTGPRNGSNVLFSAITTGSWQAESKLSHSAALPSGSWQHIAVTVDGRAKTAAMYLNGIRVASATGVDVKPGELYDPAKAYSGYVGRSLYAADPYFVGEVDDFRVYTTALSAPEILSLAGKDTSIGGVALPQLKVDAIIDDAAGTIKLPVKPGTDVRALAPTFTLAAGSTISPATARDFTAPVTYQVTAADGSTRTWTVSAVVMRSPVLPGLFADPNIAVFGDTFWMYATTDGFAGWSGTQFRAFSSKDLVNWTDHGVILDLGPDVSWADNSAWAPAIASRDGTYYLYFSGGLASGNTAKHLGVAVSDSPAGPFRDPLGKPLVAAGTFSGQMIDPAVFTDDDGSTYLYWGNGNSYQVELTGDVTAVDVNQVNTVKPVNYNEGSFVIKRDGKYYFMWSENDTRSPDYQVAYATGPTPLGPWSDRIGVILQKDPSQGILGTGHHSVVQVPNSDEWYIAYHRFAIPGGDGTHRETTIDRLHFTPDGSITPVVPTLESIDPVTIAHAGPDATGPEGAAIKLAGRVSNDANRPVWTYTAGAGADPGATCSFADPHAAATTVTCTDDGEYTVTLTAGANTDSAPTATPTTSANTDSAPTATPTASASTDSARLSVTNAAPVATAPDGRPAPDAPVATGTPVVLTVPVPDGGRNDTVTCVAAWGDGTTSESTAADGRCTFRHTYRAAGAFRPTVSVKDDDGATGSPVTMPFVVTYKPGAGQVAGAGWAGTVDFAFTARGGAFGGSTWIRLPSGVFEATSQGPGVVLGSSAVYGGVGTVNGTGRYGFTVTASDQRHGDRIGITIWELHTGKMIHNSHSRPSGGSVVVAPHTKPGIR